VNIASSNRRMEPCTKDCKETVDSAKDVPFLQRNKNSPISVKISNLHLFSTIEYSRISGQMQVL
ncbi:hypothetical protein A2U01_0028289, partial [Trifolium medium]|nr:hypothetical protein [Trifolium medium]